MRTTTKTTFSPVHLSLEDLLGAEYVDAVCAANAHVTGDDEARLGHRARQKVDFFPAAFRERLLALLPKVGTVFSPSLGHSAHGASSAAFNSHTNTAHAPLAGFGFYRVGEDGRLYLTSKSEHYHAPLGHAFPGYALIDHARLLRIPNATHNNARGHITRLLEEELLGAAAGISREDRSTLDQLLASTEPAALNRVLNLQTGSLAVEAAIKMALGRFYKIQKDSPEPKYAGRIPVLLVMGDDEGGAQANYHGTTVLAQAMRGMWPDLACGLERQEFALVRSVRPNNFEELENVFKKYDAGRHKIAAFFHELVLMNYGAVRLTQPFVSRIYELCEAHDVPTVVDEIQTCPWSPQLFMFREYGVKPAFVAVGKGLSGGESPASRILFGAGMDCLPQFGALVTNGQEELSALSYLITMRWCEANAAVTEAVGNYYEGRLAELRAKHTDIVSATEGRRHLSGVYFHDLDTAKAFVAHLQTVGLDISVQTYKAGCPPSALTKLPLIAGYEVVDMVIGHMENAVERMAAMRDKR